MFAQTVDMLLIFKNWRWSYWFTMLAVSIIVGIGVFILEINFQPNYGYM